MLGLRGCVFRQLLTSGRMRAGQHALFVSLPAFGRGVGLNDSVALGDAQHVARPRQTACCRAAASALTLWHSSAACRLSSSGVRYWSGWSTGSDGDGQTGGNGQNESNSGGWRAGRALDMAQWFSFSAAVAFCLSSRQQV